jgi:hypothetical protein
MATMQVRAALWRCDASTPGASFSPAILEKMRMCESCVLAASFLVLHARAGSARERAPEDRAVPSIGTPVADTASDSTALPARPPPRLPYRKGESYPGYHIEERPRPGLIIGGALGWGGVYSLLLYPAIESERPLLMIPVAGPWIELQSVNPEGQLIFALAGVAQIATLGVLASGFIFPKKYFIRDDETPSPLAGIRHWRIVPHIFEGAKPGLTLCATFD